jgi:hypothetical protein
MKDKLVHLKFWAVAIYKLLTLTLKGQRWHILYVDLEESDGVRVRYTAMKHCDHLDITRWERPQ